MLILELDGYGPMEIRINDRATVLNILTAGVIDNPFTVSSYSARTEAQLSKILVR